MFRKSSLKPLLWPFPLPGILFPQFFLVAWFPFLLSPLERLFWSLVTIRPEPQQSLSGTSTCFIFFIAHQDEYRLLLPVFLCQNVSSREFFCLVHCYIPLYPAQSWPHSRWSISALQMNTWKLSSREWISGELEFFKRSIRRTCLLLLTLVPLKSKKKVCVSSLCCTFQSPTENYWRISLDHVRGIGLWEELSS